MTAKLLKEPLLSPDAGDISFGFSNSVNISVSDDINVAIMNPYLVSTSYESNLPSTNLNDKLNLDPNIRFSSLILPEYIKTVRSVNNNNNDKLNTISLSRDIFTTIIVLKVYRIWDTISPKHRLQLKILLLICILLQFGLLLSLWIEIIVSPPWDDVSEDDRKGSEIEVLITKFWCLIAVLLYIFKELYELQSFFQLRKEVQDFRETISLFFSNLYYFYHILLYLMSMGLSVALISTSESGFEAVLNAVGILFILDIDNWIYSMIKSHHYIQNELFEIKYENYVDTPTYSIAKYKYFSQKNKLCFFNKNYYKSKAENTQNFISLIKMFIWGMLIFAISLICLGFYYKDEWHILIFIGCGILICGCVYVICERLLYSILNISFYLINKKKINQFTDIKLPFIIHKYIKKLNQNNNDIIINEFIRECYKYFDKNICGVYDTNKKVKEKLIAAFNEYYNNCDKNNIKNIDVDHDCSQLGLKFCIYKKQCLCC